jgi:hypothetical protein
LVPRCHKCAQLFEGDRCPACGATATLSREQVNRILNRHAWPIFVGLVGILLGTRLYPVLDATEIYIVALAGFFIPVLAHVVLAARKRLVPHVNFLRLLYRGTGVLLIALAALVLGNGFLDRSPAKQVVASVTRKNESYSRRGSTYSLIVSPSWRAGRNNERLEVSARTFSKVRPGASVAIDVHRGAFGIEWFSRVEPY